MFVIITCGVGGGTVPSKVVGQLQLWQLDARVDIKWHCVVPFEDKIVCCM